MQVEHRDLYWFGLEMPYVQWEIEGLYCLAPESASSRGVQAGLRERAKSQVSALCGGQSTICYSGVCVVLPWVLVLRACLGCVPWFPFYSLKGTQGFYMCDRWSPSVEWWSHSPDPVEAYPSRPWGMADNMVALVEGRRALLRSWGLDRWHCCMSSNSRTQPIVTLVNLSHTSFTMRRYTTVKEVRLHSERGKATVAGVVGIVAAMPCRDMGITASVMSRVQLSCVGSLASTWGLGRGGTCARGQEVGRVGAYARGQGVGRARAYARG